jgi:isopentenyl-diphosphate delta-isomerase type 1
VWTNSCCGHPKPGERIEDAVVRRVRQELGVTVQPRLVLPGFRYRAVSAEGVVENEVCPVFVADGADDPRPDPAEVAEWAWVPWRLLPDLVAQAPVLVSPWMVLQVPQLAAVLA